MKFRGTLLLAGLLVLLCLGYGTMQWRRARVVEEEIAAKRLFNFEPESVRSLEIQRVGEAVSAAEKDGQGQWRITQPDPSIEAFALMWNRVAKTFAFLQNERTITAKLDDLTAYGLSEPALRVKAQAANGEAVSLAFGALDPTEGFRYAQADGGDVFLVTKDAYFELNRPLQELRRQFLVNDREAALLRLEFARIWTHRDAEKVKLENPPAIGEESISMILEREAPDKPWRMIAPQEAPVDQEQVEVMSAAIQFGIAHDFIDAPESLADYGLDPPSARITVVDASQGQRQTIFIGDDVASTEKGPKGTYAKWEQNASVFVLDPDFMSKCPAAPDTFRERRLLLHPVSDIQALEFKSASEDFRIEKDEKQGWRMTRPEFPDTDQAVLSRYLSDLKEVRANDFPDTSLNAPAWEGDGATITLTYAKGTAPGVIRIAKQPVGENQYYVTQEDGTIAAVYANDVTQLMTTAAAFRSPEIMRFAKEDAVKLSFRFEAVDYLLEKTHERWVILEPENKILANQGDAALLLDAVSQVFGGAEGNPLPDLAAYGLDVPLLALTVTTRSADDPAPEKQIGPLSIGNVTADDSQRRFAMMAGRPGIFRVKQTVIEGIREGLKGVQDK